MDDDPATRVRENLTEITATLVTGLWLLLLFTPGTGQLWLPVLLVGYIVVVPIVALLFGDEADRREWWEWEDEESEAVDSSDETSTTVPSSPSQSNNRDALETLRERYARGELTDEQFEHKLERLLETETLEDVEAWAGDARDERNRNLEYET